jgi:ferritin-like metal-binding protein YciE
MKKISSLNDLLMEELADLLSAERQFVDVLPKLTQASSSSALKLIFEDHLEVAREHAHRLQDIFNNITQRHEGNTCKVMKSLVEQSERVIERNAKGAARDMSMIDMVQRIEHYEIGGYVIAREHASDLGHSRIVELLEESLNEEREMNAYLNELAQCLINIQAIDPKSESERQRGFYMPEEKFKRRSFKKSEDIDVSRLIGEGDPNNQEPNGTG